MSQLPQTTSSDSRRGLGTVISRFGNLLHLTISYFLFGRAGAFVYGEKPGSDSYLYSQVISNISNKGKFGSSSWSSLSSSMDQYLTTIDASTVPIIKTGAERNCLFLINKVIFPYYNLGVDMSKTKMNYYFELNLILMMMIGELYLDPNETKLSYFGDIYEQAVSLSHYYRLEEAGKKTIFAPPAPIQTSWFEADWEKEAFCQEFWVPIFIPKKL